MLFGQALNKNFRSLNLSISYSFNDFKSAKEKNLDDGRDSGGGSGNGM